MRWHLVCGIVLVCSGFFSTMNVESAPFTSGNELVDHMKENDKAVAGQKEVDWLKTGLYIGFVGGVYDACDGAFFCASPSEPTQGEITAVVSKYLKEHPERWNEPAVVLIVDALKAAYPCPQQNNQ
ncbi:MAG: hypothetical protein FJ264_00110 [Planctomycetes bacterium]|nr:hypothetical protein [Planctomycetota bacterium]